MNEEGNRQKNSKRIVSIFCVVLLGSFSILQSWLVAKADSQMQLLMNMQKKDVVLGKGKPKRTYYNTVMQSVKYYTESYDLYKKKKLGLCWKAYFKGDKLYFHGSMVKSKVKDFPSSKKIYLGDKKHLFITTSKTKYYLCEGDDDAPTTTKISKKRFSAFLEKVDKEDWLCGIVLIKENGKVTRIEIAP